MENAQTHDEIRAELEKLNKSQRAALRGRFAGGLTALKVEAVGSYTRVTFAQEHGRRASALIGIRGRLCHLQGNY